MVGVDLHSRVGFGAFGNGVKAINDAFDLRFRCENRADLCLTSPMALQTPNLIWKPIPNFRKKSS